MTTENETADTGEERAEQEEQAPRAPTGADYFNAATEWLSLSMANTRQVSAALQTQADLNSVDRHIAIAQVAALTALTNAILASVLSERELAAAARATSAENAANIAEAYRESQSTGETD